MRDDEQPPDELGVQVLTAEQAMDQEIVSVALRRGEQDLEAVRASLVGLALSGGGIRSATFSLGVLEGLKEHGLLERIDYLSTVSGGGYIGGWLSANCLRAAERAAARRDDTQPPASGPAVTPREPEPPSQRELAKRSAHKSWLAKDANWTLAIDHLRRYSNYLAPKLGLFSADTWSMVTIWLRNTMLVQATVMAALACLLLLPRLSKELFELWPETAAWRWTTVVLFIFAVAGVAANLLQLSRGASHAVKVADSRRTTPLALLFIVTLIVLIRVWELDPFAYAAIPLVQSLTVALLAIGAGYLLLPLGMQIVNQWTSHNFERVNYTQGWVQWAVVVPMIVTGFLIAAVLWGQTGTSPFGSGASFGTYLQGQWRYWPFPLMIALASLWLFAWTSLCPSNGNREIDADAEGQSHRAGRLGRLLLIFLGPLPALAVFYVAICAILQLLRGWFDSEPGRGVWLAVMWGPSLVLFAFSLAIVALIGMLGRSSLESVREWWSRLGAWLSIYAIAWLGISLATILGPTLAETALTGTWMSWFASGGWVMTTLGGLLAARSSSTGSDTDDAPKSKTDVARRLLVAIGPVVFIMGLLVLVATLLHRLIVNTSDAVEPLGYWAQMEAQSVPQLLWIWLGLAFVTLLLNLRVDINVFNLNAFYRNRLVRCYLGAARFLWGERTPQNFIGMDEFDDLPISALARQPAPAPGQTSARAAPATRESEQAPASGAPPGPFHIVNCALNLGGSSDLALHTRHSASFIITPYVVGSGYTGLDAAHNEFPVGYRNTVEYGGRTQFPTLGQAISVSGAAASPNMGYHTAATAAFLLTMFNARLGWWFPAPGRQVERSSPRHSLFYLARELFGLADERAPFLNISDGGHFENLGAYELIRRKCQTIIISDAECDASLRCEGLARLIRMCSVDFDTEIMIDVSAIRGVPGTTGSRDRCAAGKITYNASSTRQPTGTLIYIKAAVSGQEDTAILQYKATHPSFPHESTGNQFYGEDQFESYRSLGRDIAREVFRRVVPDSGPLPSWTTLGAELEALWAPTLATSAQFTNHSRSLMDLWSRLASDPDLKRLESLDPARLAAEWPDGSVPAAFEAIYYLGMQIIQLMENVYLDLDFEKTWGHVDNEGWQETFRKWAALPAIRKTWSVSAATFGRRFQHFCKRNLGLPMLPRAVP